MMKKNLILIALFCVGALGAENYGLWFNETQMTDANRSFLNGQVVYHPTTNVLTINNANDTASYLTIDQNVTLYFIGNSKLAGIYQSTPEDVYTLTIITEGSAKLTVTHESAFYVNDFIVTFKNCDFTLDNSFRYGITQPTLFAGDITFEGCSVANPVNGKASAVDGTGYYTITDGSGNFVRTFTIQAQSSGDSGNSGNGIIKVSTKLYGGSSNSAIVPRRSTQGTIQKRAIIQNRSASLGLEVAKREAEDVFASEMARMDINLPDPIRAVVQFGEPSQFSDMDELCIVETNYLDHMPASYPYYPHIGGNPAFSRCLFPYALVNLAYQGEYIENEPCMTIYLNPDKNYYYGQDPEGIADDQYDMVTVILRGLVIGCGFQSSFKVHPDGTLTIGQDVGEYKYFTVLDANLRNEAYSDITGYVWNEGDLRTFLNTRVYGPNNVELCNELRVCSDCTPSSSTLNAVSYDALASDPAITAADLMEPVLYQGMAVRAITHYTEQVLHGLGWMYDVAVSSENLRPCNIVGSALLYANTNYSYYTSGGYGNVNGMTCNLFAVDSVYTLGSGVSDALTVSFDSLPDNNWERNPVNNNIMGVVKAEEETLVDGRFIRTVSTLPIEVPYKPNKPLFSIKETTTGNTLKVDVEAFAGGSDQYIVTCTPTIPGITRRDTVTADVLSHTIDNLSSSQSYGITIEGLNDRGKSTAVHQLVGQYRLPLTLHITASLSWITYYFTENGNNVTELDIASVRITDANGTVVQTCDAAQNEQISIAGLNANTVYLLVVTLEDGRAFSKQFIKR